MSDFDGYVYVYHNDDDDVTTTPANFDEVHELLDKLKEKKDEEPQNTPIMESGFRKPKLTLNNPTNDKQKQDRFKGHDFEGARKLQLKQNGSAKRKK